MLKKKLKVLLAKLAKIWDNYIEANRLFVTHHVLYDRNNKTDENSNK
jgi:hypothetical protein